MSELNDELNKNIDRLLRDAHQQVNPRPEWAERVLREINCQREPNNDVVPSVPIRRPPRFGWSNGIWQSAAAIAAALMLAIAYGSWRASSSGQNFSNAVIDSKSPVVAQKELLVELPEKLPHKPSTVYPQQSVSAAPGYLAGRLINDPDFEIYVVLPTRNTIKIH